MPLNKVQPSVAQERKQYFEPGQFVVEHMASVVNNHIDSSTEVRVHHLSEEITVTSVSEDDLGPLTRSL